MFAKIYFIFFLLIVFCPDSQAKTIHVYTNQDPANRDFGIRGSDSEPTYIITAGIFETLITWDPEQRKYLPSLAETWEFTKPNEVTFYLRKNVRFHDGTLFDAYDVIESFALIQRHSAFGSFLLSQIQSVQAVNQYSVKFILKNPDLLILRRMAFWFRIFPSNSSKNKSELYGFSVQGTGPWKFVKRESNIFIFKYFPKYWDQLPETNNDLVIHTSISDPMSVLPQSGDIVIVDGLPWDSQLDALKHFDLNIRKTQNNYSDFGIFNTLAQGSIVQDIRIRKAINLAINREALTRLVYEGNVMPLSSLSLPNEDGHDSNLQPYKYDLVVAQQLVDDFSAEHPEKPLIIRIGMQSTGKTYQDLEHFIEASLAQIGIKTVIVANYSVALQKQQYSQLVDMILGGDPSPYGHFDFTIKNFFVDGSIFQTVSDIEINALLQRVFACATEDQINLIYEKIDRIIHDQYYAITGVQYNRIVAYDKRISMSPMYSTLMFMKYVR